MHAALSKDCPFPTHKEKTKSKQTNTSTLPSILAKTLLHESTQNAKMTTLFTITRVDLLTTLS